MTKNKYFENSEEFNNQINPVVKYARGSLAMLEYAGVKEAIDFSRRMHNSSSGKIFQNDFQKVFYDSIAILHEVHYRTINYYLNKAEMGTIIDLGCGFSPRNYAFSKNTKINYIGVDLPAVIDKLRVPGNDMNYIAGDITNLASLEKALKNVSGSIVILTDDVLPYLTSTELKTAIENIKALLLKHKGIWITSDFFTGDYLSAVLKPFLGQEKFNHILGLLQNLKKSEDYYDRTKSAVVEKGLDLLKEMGFMHKIVPAFPEGLYCPFFTGFDRNIQEEIRENYKFFKISVISLESELTPDFEKALEFTSNQGFNFTVKLNPESVEIILNGRLDTLSAPGLLDFFQKDMGKEKEIFIDCKNLDYVSSAGLRVFLIMFKTTKGKTKLKNVNETVQEILEQTGFSQFLL